VERRYRGRCHALRRRHIDALAGWRIKTGTRNLRSSGGVFVTFVQYRFATWSKAVIRAIALSVFMSWSLVAEAESVLIENVRIFDGVDATLTPGHVLVEDGLISKISAERIEPPAAAVIIDGDNRVLSPGFIDLHAHLTMHVPPSQGDAHATVAGAVANDVARHFLNSGFTTVRDAGGTHPDLARAINSGTVYGPRVYPSGAILSQTAGHGDWRHSSVPNPTLGGSSPYIYGDMAVIVDGVDQHLAAVRENLRFGATQIKIMGGGGVMSEYDPIDSLQPSPPEIRAAVQAASDFGTYWSITACVVLSTAC